ncbi:MAG TPA: helix-hairpin-helix domain-containing protein [Polyangiaceae bacterium]|nr:helix-hairpin-helix domain-containing protein [Polyangiaceae bacterium]
MSIFSRLFNKNAEGDGKEPSDDESAASEKRDEKRTHNSKSPATEGKTGTMRPVAPSLQINPPVAERDASAGPVVQVGEVSKGGQRAASSDKSGSSAARGAASSAKQGGAAQADHAKARPVGKQTQRLGSNVSAPAYAAPPATGTSPRRSSRPPKLETNAAATAAVGGGQRTTGWGDKSPPDHNAGKAVVPRSPVPAHVEGQNGPLTLDLGSSSMHGEANFKNFKFQGAPMNPQPQQAAPPAAQPRTSPIHEPEIDQSWSVPPAKQEPDATNKLLSDLDEAFGAIVDSANGSRRSLRPSASPPPNASIAELRELFSSLAANHMQQVRDFMIGVRWGEAPRDWIPICEPAVASLLRAAKEMELVDLAKALEGYRESLSRAADATGTTIAGDTRDGLNAAYAKLSDLMPEAFGLDGERGRREAIIVHALLQQVPEVRKITIDKIYAAGLASLDNLFLAKPDEIAATTGMSASLAERIVEKVQRYRQEIASLSDATRAAERNHLAKLATELRELHQQFESVASAWSDDGHAKKKHLRQARAVALLQVKVLLARLGEVDRLAQLERLPFERKIEQLEGYLQEANGQKAAVP